MTLQEADTAALMRVPVVLTLPGGIPTEYVRITQLGYSYDYDGRQRPFVQLLDKCGRSVVNADPAYVSVNLYIKEPGQMNGKDDLHESS